MSTAETAGPPSVRSCGVSVMMPAFNAARYIGEAIESLLSQTFDDWELIVVDDGSTDGTGETVSRLDDHRITVYRHENRGEAAARNTALSHARGEYLAFLDADDCYLPNHLEWLVGHLKAHPAHVGVYSDGFYMAEDGRRLKTLSSRRRPPRTGDVFNDVVVGSDFFGPPLCVALRLEPIRRYGLRFSEDVGFGTDWDFFLRVAERGPFGFVDRVTCLYRVHRSSMTAAVGDGNWVRGRANCRARAVKMPRFRQCPVDVRVAVFYELLVHLLRREPEKQDAASRVAEFTALPTHEQARLLRLMASKAILFGGPSPFVREWLRRSRQLNAADARTAMLLALYRASPAMSQALLRIRSGREPDPLTVPPLADLEF